MIDNSDDGYSMVTTPALGHGVTCRNKPSYFPRLLSNRRCPKEEERRDHADDGRQYRE